MINAVVKLYDAYPTRPKPYQIVCSRGPTGAGAGRASIVLLKRDKKISHFKPSRKNH